MDINKILKSDYLDILFEGRNKKYGGYELRKKYPTRMRNAALIGIGVVALAIGGPVLADVIKGKDTNKPIAIMKEVVLTEPPPIDPKKPPPPPPQEPPPPVKPTVKFTPPVIKPDEEVKEDEKPPPVDDARAPGLTTQEGDPDGIDPGIIDNPSTGTGVIETPPPPKIFTYVEQMPAFDGNLQEYLSKNLRYPEAARTNGVEGRVTVQFVVSEDGSISDVKVVRGVGSGLDEEAKRVVQSMPKWRPGKQNGNPVKVQYTLPVKFTLQ